MIKIIVEENGDLHRIEMQGHAGFNPGNDIVCAAASMLIQALHASIIQGIGHGEMKSAEFSHGKANIHFKGGNSLFEMTVLGFEMLQRAYPEHVCVFKN